MLLNIDQSLRFQLYEHDTSLLAAEIAATLARETGSFLAILSTATADAPDHVLHTCAADGVPVLKGHGPGSARAWPRPRAGAPTLPDVRERAAGARPATGATRAAARVRLAAPARASPGRARSAPATPDEAVAAAAADRLSGGRQERRPGAQGARRRRRARPRPTTAGVRAAAERLGAVIVCEELRGGVEVLCGVVRDPGVGPMVLCGVGGSWAEPMRETARTMLAPLSQAEAEALVRDVLPVARRLDDAGVEAVARTLVALGDAAAADPRIAEIDVNPLRVAGGETVALDALVVLEESRDRGRPVRAPRAVGVDHAQPAREAERAQPRAARRAVGGAAARGRRRRGARRGADRHRPRLLRRLRPVGGGRESASTAPTSGAPSWPPTST